jgi:hypothetical protein
MVQGLHQPSLLYQHCGNRPQVRKIIENYQLSFRHLIVLLESNRFFFCHGPMLSIGLTGSMPIYRLGNVPLKPRRCTIFHALTLLIHSSTQVAEILATPAFHMITARWFFHPECAKRAHFVFSAFYKISKCLLVLIRIYACLILLTRHAWVLRGSASEAIIFLALRTCEIFTVNSVLKNEGIGTICSWTPWNVLLDPYSLQEWVFLKLFHFILL